MGLFNERHRVPYHGYISPEDGRRIYRATAVALMKRMKLDSVEHINGRTYTRVRLENAMLGYYK